MKAPMLPFDRKSARILRGDCAELLRSLPDASIDAIVTDPPAGIGFMGKEWDKDKGGRDAWVAWLRDIMRECLRVLKPGGHALVWALPRTSHWTGYALEEAGFEVRDRLCHLFGTGFPKSLDVSKAIDARLTGGNEKQQPTNRDAVHVPNGTATKNRTTLNRYAGATVVSSPVSPEAARWSGWGTALKPACEDWWLARKPLDGTVAANVLTHGTGALNVDGCRIGSDGGCRRGPEDVKDRGPANAVLGAGLDLGNAAPRIDGLGRWPAHVVLDDEAARALDEQSGTMSSPRPYARTATRDSNLFDGGISDGNAANNYGDSGGASRFYYVSKASKRDKTANGQVVNNHPTTKSTDLMRWLVRLITPPGGTVLDPFLGSGTTGVACAEEGFSFVGIEREAEFFETARKRIELAYGRVEAA